MADISFVSASPIHQLWLSKAFRLVSTTKEYMQTVMIIDPKWLTEVAPNRYKVADADKISKRKKNERIQPLFNKFEEKDAWRLSKQKVASRSSSTFG